MFSGMDTDMLAKKTLEAIPEEKLEGMAVETKEMTDKNEKEILEDLYMYG